MLIRLEEMTLPLLQEYYRGFQMDADVLMDMSRFREYRYDPEQVEAYYFRLKATQDRVDFLVMQGERPIGEVGLKHIDRQARNCELSIHLQNDSVKNQGFGTQAEQLATEYAFDALEMDAVYANAVLKNTRSQHVLEKLGYEKTGEDETFAHYRMKSEYTGTKPCPPTSLPCSSGR
ncbi:MAG: GNAT family N-acetyltransferase [Clostridia bacterium]|nr:GNAT family N-acetyltransferase [Clostridia bacterium]